MKPIRTQQKYRCDFCKLTGVKSWMNKHEKQCYRNPNRYCDFCNNTGLISDMEYGKSVDTPCPYCSKFDAKMKAEIEAREKLNGTSTT